MNEFSMLYRRGTTESISQVSVTYYYENHPKNIPIVDMKYNGADILKIYSDTNVVVENNEYTKIVNELIESENSLGNFIRNIIKRDIHIVKTEFVITFLFILYKDILIDIDNKFGKKT